MTTLRCDGCWRDSPHSENWITLCYIEAGDEHGVDHDLCPSCASRFEAFLKSLREEKK